MVALIQNETIKMLKKKRFLVILLILAVLIPIFTYAQLKVAQNTRKQFGTTDWRVSLQEQITSYTNRLSNSRVPDEWKTRIKLEVKRLQYYLDRNVDPSSPNAVTFTRDFVKNAIGLFLPLMVAVMAADIVSGEHTTGTIKLLLTRPVRRWRILLSKLLTLLLFVSLLVLAVGVLCYVISGLIFGYGGWSMPLFTGFQLSENTFNDSGVRAVDAWLYLLMEFGLAWFSCAVVACMSLMVSVLVRSTAAGMGIMMATIIAGVILANMVSSWETAKYFFMVNLETVNYLAGAQPPIVGMTLGFSLSVLAVWAAAALVVAFGVFTRRDILN